MTPRLHRYYGAGYLHLITFSGNVGTVETSGQTGRKRGDRRLECTLGYLHGTFPTSPLFRNNRK